MRLFRRAPALESTGHEGDDHLLREIARRSRIDAPRHWVHYVYFADEAGARSAARAIERAGWTLQTVDAAANGDGWVVIADQHDVVVTPASVQSARSLFERVAAEAGGDYDGWEASV